MRLWIGGLVWIGLLIWLMATPALLAFKPRLHTPALSCESEKGRSTSLNHTNGDHQRSIFSSNLTYSKDDEGHFRDLWPKLEVNWRVVLGTAVGILGGALGSVGGVGGGGFFLPMFNLILGFDSKTSAALSKSMVLGGALSTAFYNIFQKDPFQHRPVIDYDVVMLFQPMLLLGISIGVIFNVIFAEWMITLLTVMLFTISLHRIFKKAFALRSQETLLLKGDKEASLSNLDPLTLCDEAETSEDKSITDEIVVLKPNEERRDWSWFPAQKWFSLLLIWAVFLLVQVLKMHTTTCSLWYWVAESLQVPVAIGANLAFAVHLYKKSKYHDGKEDVNQPLLEQSEKKWQVTNLFIYAISGVGAGIVGGLLGLGGGVIMGPAFLELGLTPQATSATSTFLMVYSASLSAVEFYLLDRLPVAFATYFAIISFGAALWGQVVIRKVITSSGRASLIVLILGCCMVTSTIFLGGTGAIRSYYKWKTGSNLWFKDLCFAN